MMTRQFAACLVSVLCLSTVGSALAANQADRVRQVIGSPADYELARKAGKKAAFFCVNCHGEDGNSSHGHIPNLAGQNAVYLLNQIEKFADGRRQDEFMSGLIKVLKPEDRFNMAIYYSAEPVKVAPEKASAQIAQGKRLYEGLCKSCHGAQGYGNEKIARLAGQQSAYLKESLTLYRKGTKLRNDPVMGSVARRLKDEDIAALAAYLPTMK
jgi:cbb3-type cytochrome c oxidase subunit III